MVASLKGFANRLHWLDQRVSQLSLAQLSISREGEELTDVARRDTEFGRR